jgi:hypothetical protein
VPLAPFTVWTNPDRTRYFLIPDSLTLPSGDYVIRAPLGKRQSVDPESLLLYELSKQQAKVWVASEITGTLDAIPKGPSQAGEKVLAAGQLIRQLPDLIRLSKDPRTLPAARESGATLDKLLLGAGIESHSAFTQLPDRISAICQDPSIRAKHQEIAAELRRTSDKIEIPALRRFLEDLSRSSEEKASR